MIVQWFKWGGNEGTLFQVLNSSKFDSHGVACTKQIFERTRFSLIVNSENSWAGL